MTILAKKTSKNQLTLPKSVVDRFPGVDYFEVSADEDRILLKPVRLGGAQPAYTELARKARIQGVVIVEAIIDKEGRVTNVRVLKGLPMGLDQSAVDAVKSWRFKPATLNGRPVSVYYSLTVNFRLQ